MESFRGLVETPNDALLLFEASRLNRLDRVQRRLSEMERTAYVVPGAVFIWDEEESGIKRWTDGKHWSPSRINGSFLIYREVEPRNTIIPGVSEEKIEYVIKDGGLTKKAISITTSLGRKQHLVSYYLRNDHNRHQLEIPSDMAMFADIVISTETYPEFTHDQTSSASIASSRSSNGHAPSINLSQASERPIYVPIPKAKPVRLAKEPQSPAHHQPSSPPPLQHPQHQHHRKSLPQEYRGHSPKPSHDSGAYVGYQYSQSGDDARSFRSYDSREESSFRREPPLGGHYVANGYNHHYNPPTLHRRPPSMASVMTSPPELPSTRDYAGRGHDRSASVRSLPIGLVEGGTSRKSDLVLPMPKPSSASTVNPGFYFPTAPGTNPQFLVHTNWTPSQAHFRGGLESVGRMQYSGGSGLPLYKADTGSPSSLDGGTPMDWEASGGTMR